MTRRILVIASLLYCIMAQAKDGLDIYFVRHAETLTNAAGERNSGSSNTFSDRGNEQVKALTSKLKTLNFDAILVSPAQRAINTILPYLKESGQKGEIWPEIAECCWQEERGHIAEGQAIKIRKVMLSIDQEPYFIFRDTNSYFTYSNSSFADGVAHVRIAVGLIKQKYLHSGKTILIVSHYHSGDVLLSDLLGIPYDVLPNLENGKLTHLRQDENGHFIMLRINDKSFATRNFLIIGYNLECHLQEIYHE